MALNPSLDIQMYNFNFEMVGHQVIGRSISTDAEILLKKLYSVDEALSDEEFESLREYYHTLAMRDAYFIESPDDAETIVNSIVYYWEKNCRKDGKVMVSIIDHALLIRGKQGQSEKEKIDDLMNNLIRAKKYISEKEGKCVFIVLSQMNRDIKSVERVKNADMHIPKTSDLFGASSIEFASNYIIISHMPSKLGIPSYTAQQYPVFYEVYSGGQFVKKVPAIYFHLVKNRSGDADKVIPIKNRLQYFDLDELPLDDFMSYHEQFKATGAVQIHV